MSVGKSKLWLILTVVVGLITTALVFQYLTGLKPVAAADPMTTVVVPAKKIPQGTRITKDMLKTMQIPVKFAPAQAVSSIDTVVNQVAADDLWPDETVVSGQLGSAQTNELPYKIPEGKRAITIANNPLTGVAGHIKPGYYVDILMRYNKSDKPEDQKELTLLQKVLVLAIGPDLQKKDGVQVSDNITLAVSPSDAELIALSETTGKLKLILRPAADEKDSPVQSLDIKEFQGMYP